MAYTPGGDADLIPAYLPGSPHHADEELRGPLRGLKVAGCYFGDDEWCKEKLKAQLLKRVARLADVNRLVDTERIRCSGQLKYQLISRCASQIPNFSSTWESGAYSWIPAKTRHATSAAQHGRCAHGATRAPDAP